MVAAKNRMMAAADIPEAGNKASEGYQEGSWDVTPDANTAITDDVIPIRYGKVKSLTSKIFLIKRLWHSSGKAVAFSEPWGENYKNHLSNIVLIIHIYSV